MMSHPYENVPDWLNDAMDASGPNMEVPEDAEGFMADEELLHLVEENKHLQKDQYDTLMTTLIEAFEERKAQAEACKLRIEALTLRRKAHEAGMEFCKQKMMEAMHAQDKTKYKNAYATVSYTERAPGLVVSNEDKVPLNFFKLEKKLSKTMLNNHFKETGEIPDGCILGKKVPSLTVRTK